MKVLLFHPVQLPPRDYGGVERVVLWLAKGLLERGHEVWVGARAGSRLPVGARLLEIAPEQSSALDLLRQIPAGMEVVHFMAPPESGTWEGLPCAGLLTVHGNGQPAERFPLNSVFLSRDHANRHGAEAFVYNGIDPAECEFSPKSKQEWFLFLSKTTWGVKNLAGAMSMCREARVGLRIAGGSRPWLRRAQAAVTPGFRWEGPVRGARKARLLAEARALVFPVRWPEPFGLVVVEALMSGTPVLAARRGSLPELVSADVGALLETETEWVDALRGGGAAWDPERCRSWALEKFHYARMAEAYESLYRRVSAGERLNRVAPVAPLSQGWRH